MKAEKVLNQAGSYKLQVRLADEVHNVLSDGPLEAVYRDDHKAASIQDGLDHRWGSSYSDGW